MAVAHQLAPLFIPETEREGFKAGKQRYGFNRLKQRLRFVAFLEMIIRNARAEMVNVMKANVAGEPLQQFGKFVKRAAIQRGRGVIPILAAFPVNSLELMLNIKQPHPN